MTAWSIQPWNSTDRPAKPAGQLVPSPVNLAQFEEAAAFLAASDLSHFGFVAVSVGALSADSARKAIGIFGAMEISSRVYFAVDPADLERLDFSSLDNARAGLLLDGVESSTPLSTLANDSVEVVRFDDRFAMRAMVHLRTECVLEAMVSLVRNLGLCSLGPDLRNGARSFASVPQFDYVSGPITRLAETSQEPLPSFADTSGHAHLI